MASYPENAFWSKETEPEDSKWAELSVSGTMEAKQRLIVNDNI